VDVVRESYRLQRRLAEQGFRVRRYSGLGFAVLVEEEGGVVRGLDVFGGFFSDGHLHLMGEIRVPFREEWVRPLGTTTLEGRTFPAPADTDRFLTATYGPDWRVPDPAFSFGTPPSTYRRLDDWFRGFVVHRAEWDGRYQARIRRRVEVRPSRLARNLLRDTRSAGDAPGIVVDLGCGQGVDAYWLAGRGLRTEGLDYSHRGYVDLSRRAARKGRPVRYGILNLLETRHVLGHGARLAREPGRHTVLARHLLDALPPGRGRENVWRFADMLGRAGGRMYLDVLTAASEGDPWVRRQLLTPVPLEALERGVRSAGGTVLVQEEFTPGPAPTSPGPGGRAASGRRGCRMVVEW
jgi:SAM-dependent methyltransferase